MGSCPSPHDVEVMLPCITRLGGPSGAIARAQVTAEASLGGGCPPPHLSLHRAATPQALRPCEDGCIIDPWCFLSTGRRGEDSVLKASFYLLLCRGRGEPGKLQWRQQQSWGTARCRCL